MELRHLHYKAIDVMIGIRPRNLLRSYQISDRLQVPEAVAHFQTDPVGTRSINRRLSKTVVSTDKNGNSVHTYVQTRKLSCVNLS